MCRIHNENKLKVEQWKKIILNASGGWSIKDGNSWKTVMPSFAKILSEWERFYNNEYNLEKPKRDKCEAPAVAVVKACEPVRYEMPAEYSSDNIKKMIAENQRKAVQA